MADSEQTARPRVLVLGGGFAGVGAARALKKADVDVVIVDKHDYHTFQPLLYQVATGLLEQPGRHLVEQRLKGVVVVFVDDHDVYVALLQVLRRPHAAETATEHDHARALFVGVVPSAHRVSRRYGRPPRNWSSHGDEPLTPGHM